MSSPILLFVTLSFFPSLFILTFFFSSILTGGSTKRTFYRSAFIVSFLGLAAGTTFALVAPFLPGFIPAMDLGVLLAVVTWVLLLRYYCGTGWLESIPPAFIAAIVYVVILAVASAFSILMLQ